MGDLTTTSVRVDEDLWKEAKKKAIDEGITVTELLNQAVEEWMSRHGGGGKKLKALHSDKNGKRKPD